MPMASMVRDAGRNVVIRLAALDARTARNSTRSSGRPRMGPASAPKTLSEISSLRQTRCPGRPRRRTSAVRSPRSGRSAGSTGRTAALPDPVSCPRRRDSSLTVRAVSQPQKAKIEPESPAMKADSVSPAGLNQSRLKEIPVAESADLANAAIAKTEQDRQLEEHEHDLDLLGRGDAAVGHPGRDRQEDQTGHHVDAAVLPQRR